MDNDTFKLIQERAQEILDMTESTSAELIEVEFAALVCAGAALAKHGELDENTYLDFCKFIFNRMNVTVKEG